ncbi:origin recognition complex subunit 2 [Phanerochaete sordida]|uniref:Origin recognition complex subunit 2 n=1 Tax=Phanerochaete sordida TaxID=48140 RepID=A0A9P3GCB8_9APHY|nr:origin recognition complex subunit 2 [Phanerochaete sordida]
MSSSEGSLSEGELSDDLGYGHNTFATTSFDQYFVRNYKSTRTSKNVFSDLLTPLTAEQYTSAVTKSTYKKDIEVPWLGPGRDLLLSRFLLQLEEGFNLLLYGAGSKREVLNALAKRIHKRRRSVLVVNAFHPGFTIKDLVASIESIPALQDSEAAQASGSGIEAQTRRIHRFFASSEQELYLTIHNIDAPALRKPQAQSCLSILAGNPRIHIAASVDNIAFPQLWSLTELFAHKSVHGPDDATAPARGYAWLFHDVTTLAPYDFETAHADRASIKGASPAAAARAQKDVPGTSAAGLVTEVAARHILVSVTQKAKKLFVLLGARQLENAAAVEAAGGASQDPQQVAFDYSMLFNAARENFVATNDTAMRALMAEFKDHGLMVSVTLSSGGEAIWIPLRKDALTKLVQEMAEQSK